MAGKSLNRVQLIGNLGKDPEIKYTPQGTPLPSSPSLRTNASKTRPASGRIEPNGTMSCSGNVWPRLPASI